MSIESEDLRAAVAAGILNEAQAASLKALSDQRQGLRAGMPSEDEPFEFFKGFSEIFVSLGLIILMAGVVALLGWVGGPQLAIFLPIAVAAIAWWWATYFTLKRRMNLPSMVLVVAFGFALYTSSAAFMLKYQMVSRTTLVIPALIAVFGLALWYRRFRLPFAAFVLGLYGLIALYGTVANVQSVGPFGTPGLGAMFDLRAGSVFPLATLAFGIVAFFAAMRFDLRDPNRLGRHAATGFWLHMLAAPALVNTVAMTLYNLGGTAGMLTTAAALAVIAVLALVIDRRSFLTAGLAYLALVIGWAIKGEDGGGFGDWVAILLILGATVTALGTWWVPIRRVVMRALPNFPGKSKLPPYVSA